MKLVLVRHGTTDWNESGRLMGRLDIALNERGVRQAEAAARALQGLQPDAIVASPQRRTHQTAATIAAAVGTTTVTLDDNLAEVWVGPWEGRRWAELQNDPDVAAYLSDPLYQCAAVEPCTAVRDRVVAAVTAWRQRAGDAATLVFVSHGDPLRILAAHCMGLDVARFRRLEIAPGSLSVVDAPAGHAGRVLLLNFQPTDGLQRVLA